MTEKGEAARHWIFCNDYCDSMAERFVNEFKGKVLRAHTVLTILYSYCTHKTVLILYSQDCTHTVLTIGS
jgi:hypothetical protein